MHRSFPLGFALLVAVARPAAGNVGGFANTNAPAEFVGSAACRDCHPDFHQRWATSHHSRTLRPYADAAGDLPFPPQDQAIRVGNSSYRFETDAAAARVTAVNNEGVTNHPVTHVIGGRDIYYFLTQLAGGRLQVLPVGYDLRTRVWFDVPASALRRHADGTNANTATPLDWRAREYTFNAACIECHASQVTLNYSAETDVYRTTWRESGINCEICHGPGGDHARAFTAARATGNNPPEAHIVRMAALTPARRDDICAACHAKRIALTAGIHPGDAFFDHFDLLTLEDRDFYADGRELGETYTLTSWRLNPCTPRGQLECLHCHTSSGRYQFDTAHANDACLPCHAQRVRDVIAHSHHTADSPASRCIACHMPQGEFARMRRTDHSLRPPMPAATLQTGSPNACNGCHRDQPATWANAHVEAWYTRDYQRATLAAAALVTAARNHDWTRLPDIAAYLADDQREEIFATALVRLISACPDPQKWPVLLRAVKDPSPLLRASAALSLKDCPAPDALTALSAAAADPVRLVRIRAGAALAGREPLIAGEAARAAVQRAQLEFQTAMKSRLDLPTACVNLGNFYLDRQAPAQAIPVFEQALRLDPEHAGAHINLALTCNANGDAKRAEAHLRTAAMLEPGNPAAQLNLGLLFGEQGRTGEAVAALRAALRADPQSTTAAFNLAVLVADAEPAEALGLLHQACALEPYTPRYAFALAHYQRRGGDVKSATDTLEGLLRHDPAVVDAYMLLGEMHLAQGDPAAARAVFERAARQAALPAPTRTYFAAQARALADAS